MFLKRRVTFDLFTHVSLAKHTKFNTRLVLIRRAGSLSFPPLCKLITVLVLSQQIWLMGIAHESMGKAHG